MEDKQAENKTNIKLETYRKTYAQTEKILQG